MKNSLLNDVKSTLQNKTVVITYPMFRQDAGLEGLYAYSKAGHDAGECYVIVSAAGNYCDVANGKNRTIQKPKRKNGVHLDISKQAVADIELLLKGEVVSSNLKLAQFIKKVGRAGLDCFVAEAPRNDEERRISE